jgi:hypothetical protein
MPGPWALHQIRNLMEFGNALGEEEQKVKGNLI